jgi:group I intron endonuclease
MVPIIGIYKITSHSGKIYNSINKHGWDNHHHEIIEECTLDKLNERETYWKQYYIDQYGWSEMLFCELYDKGSGPRSEEVKNKIRNKRIGTKHSDETKKYLSEVNLGRKHSEYTKNKISESKKGKTYNITNFSKCISINQYSKSGEFIKYWNSISKAGKELSIDIGSITQCCKQRLKTAGGFIWKYKIS